MSLTQTFVSLMRRLSAAGFKREFARVAVLPEWWTSECEDDQTLLPEIEFRVARFINAPLSVVHDPSTPLVAPTYGGAQLRRVRDINKDRLSPAIHAALQIAASVVRNMRSQPLCLPPADPISWRNELGGTGRILLRDILSDLWKRGIPVIHIETLPTPSFQGLAAFVEKRPAIVIGHNLDEPARLAFIIAHEAAHIVFGDCEPNRPVVDEQEEVSDDHEIEARADGYATRLMTSDVHIPNIAASGFKDLATKAMAVEKGQGIDASAVIWAWARKSGNYPMAQMAAQALYRTKGGKRILRELFDQYVDLDNAVETDQTLLRCLYTMNDSRRNAIVDR